ncbi:hypothetical protein [Cytobacillus firmus]
MLRKFIGSLVVLFLISFGTIVSAESNQLFDVPITKQSEQWKVELGEVKYDNEITRPQKGKNEMYGLKVTNVGKKDLKNVKIDFYRGDPDSMTKYGLHTPSERQAVFKKGMDFSFSNLPISLKATELEVVISWQDDPSTHADGQVVKGREYKQTFTFTCK